MHVNGSRIQCSIDATYIFDLDAGGILHYPSYLGYTFRMTDFIAREIKTIPHVRLRLCGLEIVGLESEQVLEIFTLLRRHPGLSYKDVSAYVLARDTESILLTGDAQLRAMAERNGVECHGTLWILDALVDGGILEGEHATDAVRRMRELGRWLPKKECEARMNAWGQ